MVQRRKSYTVAGEVESFRNAGEAHMLGYG